MLSGLNRGLLGCAAAFCAGWLVMTGAAVAATADAPLSVSFSPDHQLNVQWQGQPLVVGERLSSIGADPFKTAEGTRTSQVNGWTVHNAWRVKDEQQSVTYRREVAVNDREVELTVQFRVPAYYVPPDNGTNVYGFQVPLKALEGMTFHTITGRGPRPQDVSGKITADMPDGPIIKGGGGSSTRFAAFENGDRHLIFDFNPRGVVAFNDYGPTLQEGYWRIDKKGDQLLFYFGRDPTLYNGVFNAKVRIVEGTFADYDKYHAHRSYAYYSVFPSIRQFAFGAGTAPKGWTSAVAAYSKDAGYGWESADGLKQQGDISGGELRGWVYGPGEKSFLVDVPQPGIYILTVRTASEQAVGPFSLACDGKIVAKDVTLQPDHVQSLVFHCYTESRQIRLTWSGQWAAGSVAVQALIYKPQDFAFKRGSWLADDVPTPTNMFMFERNVPEVSTAASAMPEVSAPQAAASTAIQTGVWTQKGAPENILINAKVPAGKVNVPAPDDSSREWRWWGNITGFGPGNNGSFYEFETDEQINRRLDELQKLGYRIILINGLLQRHVWVEQLPRVADNITRIVKLAHARGFKVLDHQDLTIVSYQDAGYNVLLDHLDWAQRDVRNGQITRGWCLNNPNFQAHYWKYMSDLARQTGLDGFMIDETTFHGEMFCGCEYCREKFYRDTGVRLPDDGPDLMNRNSRLWKLWLSWRIKTVGDWYVEMRDQLEKVNPHLVIMKYTTDYGLSSNYASVGYGGSLPESARAVGFLGTEIMSRNLYATFRSNLAARQMFDTLHYAFGSPIFGLVYPVGQPVFAYSGWVQNNMNGQVTWAMIGNDRIEKDAVRYTDWKDNMDLRHARRLAKVAILFSLPSRNFPKYYGHHDDMLGTADQLGDLHVPYQMILNRDLTAQKLKNFELLILPSDCSMSDAELAAVKAYLEQGGRVLSMGHTGVLDELGFDRKVWPIGQWIGLKFTGTIMRGPIKLSGDIFGDAPVEFPGAVLQVQVDPKAPVKPLILARADDGRHKNPTEIAAAEGRVGKGTLTVVLPRLGAANYESESTVGRAWTYTHDPVMADLFTRVIDRVRPSNPLFKAVAIPRAVRITTFRQPAADGGTTTLVHLYNGTGVDLKKGDTVPGIEPKQPFPALSDDIVFEVAVDGAGPVTGDVVSPDYTGARPIRIESLEGGRVRVTVDKKDLVAYSMVRLNVGRP